MLYKKVCTECSKQIVQKEYKGEQLKIATCV